MRIKQLCLFAVFVPTTLLAQNYEWTPRLFREGNIFPSLIIATANLPHTRSAPFSLGEGDGNLDLLIKSPSKNARVNVHIESANFNVIHPTDYQIVLPQPGTLYTVNPVVNWNYPGMASVKVTQPINVTFKVSINDGPAESKTITGRLRSINDCVFASDKPDGSLSDQSWAFAAYVDETNPGIDQFLRAMLNTGDVTSIEGYQEGPSGVYQQIYALWDVLLRLGFRYSNIADMPQPGSSLHVQQVRLLNDSMRTMQSNCVDGTVMMASILEKAGIRCFLCLVPGHCFLGVYLDPQKAQPIAIETTMMGSASAAMAQAPEANSFSALFSPTTKQSVAWQTFNAAVLTGSREFNQSLARGQLKVIDIQRIRQVGIQSINISPQ